MKSTFILCSFLIAVNGLVAQKGGATTQAENRNSGRANGDKCCPMTLTAINGNGQTQNISIDMFSGQNMTGPVTAILYDKQGKENEVENAIAFSSDGKKLNFILSKFCHPDCPPDWKIAFISGGKREEFIIQNCNSWPPTAKKVVAKQN
jgi:hypothetical protein